MNDDLEGEFAYGEFMLTKCKGVGYGSLMVRDTGDETTDIAIGDLYRFVQNGTATTINAGPAAPTSVVGAAATGSSPTASSSVSWTASPDADSYKIQRQKDGGAWVAGTPATGASSPSVQTGLSSGSWKFRVIAVNDGVDSAPSAESAAVVVA
jgi:hypothetical protein